MHKEVKQKTNASLSPFFSLSTINQYIKHLKYPILAQNFKRFRNNIMWPYIEKERKKNSQWKQPLKLSNTLKQAKFREVFSRRVCLKCMFWGEHLLFGMCRMLN